jgi:predicted N-acetyltransferase YhbS
MLDIAPEGPDDGPEIERLLDLSFGPDRRNKVSYRYRPGIAPVAGLSLVARDEQGRLAGAIRYWPVRLGPRPALLLGPLAIDPDRQGQGDRAGPDAGEPGSRRGGGPPARLPGRRPGYYARYGFRVVPSAIRVPDEEAGRVQYLTLAGVDLPTEGGEILRADGGSVAAGAPTREGVPARRVRAA